MNLFLCCFFKGNGLVGKTWFCDQPVEADPPFEGGPPTSTNLRTLDRSDLDEISVILPRNRCFTKHDVSQQVVFLFFWKDPSSKCTQGNLNPLESTQETVKIGVDVDMSVCCFIYNQFEVYPSLFHTNLVHLGWNLVMQKGQVDV